jgi:hypothetical protein
MRTFLFACILPFLLPVTLMAGGDRFVAEIVSLDPLPQKPEEYRLVLRQYTQPYGVANYDPPRVLKIRLRRSGKIFGNRHPDISHAEYLRCVELLKQQLARGGKFKFAIVGGGYEPIEGVDDEWQSNTLSRSPAPDFFVTSYDKLP